jgi:prolipoprotein diacylglyceryl transferase
MYPDLSYFFHDLFGTSPDNALSVIKTFGLFLAFSFVTSAYLLYLEFKRREESGVFTSSIVSKSYDKQYLIKNMVINGLIAFFLGFKLPYIFQNFDVFKGNPASVVFSAKGNLLFGVLAAIAFGTYYYFAEQKSEYFGKTIKERIWPSQRISDITIIAAISGIIGARLFSIFENMEGFISDPLGTLFSGSGLTIYGGLILAFIVVYWYVNKIGIKPIEMMDAVAPSLVLGYGVGRMGCHFSGDGDWGIVNELDKPAWFLLPDSFWSYSYPRNVLREGIEISDCVGQYCRELSPAVFPTPIYEIFACGLILAILWSLRKRIKIPGVLFFIYLTLNGVERFFIEQIRVNERYDLLGLNWSLSQTIAFVFIGIGIVGALFLIKKKE